MSGLLAFGVITALPAAAAPTLFRITPAAISFSSVLVNTTAPTQTVTVTNVSASSIVMSGTGGTVAAPFTRTTTCTGATLAAGASCNMVYGFHPTTTGGVNTTSAGTWNGQSYSIFMSGAGATPKFNVNTSSAKFGRLLVGTDATPTIVDIVNVSPGAVIMSGTGGAVAAPFSRTTDCTGVTLQPGDDCHESFFYHPTAAVSSSATSTTTWNGFAVTVHLSGTGVLPAFRITPTKLSFGATPVGTTPPTQVVTITNLSAQPITGALVGGGVSAPYNDSQSCQSVTLNPLQSCQFNFTFHPTSAGTQNATASGTMNGQAFTIHLTGKGVPTAPSAPTYRFSPAALSFASVLTGTTKTQQVFLTNVSSAAFAPSGTVTSPGAPFSVSVSSCPSSLAPGASCVLDYSFSPTATGGFNTTATGTINGQALSVFMSGSGATPKFNVNTGTLKFGRLLVGSSSIEQVAIITNVSVDAITMSGSGGGVAAPFAFSENCSGVVLDPGDACEEFFGFDPTAAVSSTATSSATWNGVAVTVNLSGTGVLPTWLVTPTKLNFGPVKAGTTSANQTVTVTNLSAQPLTVVFSGSVDPPFGGSTTCSSAALNYGDTCSVTYGFSPTGAGTFNDTSSLFFNSVHFNINLTGKGTP